MREIVTSVYQVVEFRPQALRHLVWEELLKLSGRRALKTVPVGRELLLQSAQDPVRHQPQFWSYALRAESTCA